MVVRRTDRDKKTKMAQNIKRMGPRAYKDSQQQDCNISWDINTKMCHHGKIRQRQAKKHKHGVSTIKLGVREQ